MLLEAETDCVPSENLDGEKGSYVKQRVNGILEMKYDGMNLLVISMGRLRNLNDDSEDTITQKGVCHMCAAKSQLFALVRSQVT